MDISFFHMNLCIHSVFSAFQEALTYFNTVKIRKEIMAQPNKFYRKTMVQNARKVLKNSYASSESQTKSQNVQNLTFKSLIILN